LTIEYNDDFSDPKGLKRQLRPEGERVRRETAGPPAFEKERGDEPAFPAGFFVRVLWSESWGKRA